LDSDLVVCRKRPSTFKMIILLQLSNFKVV
jgi:hypothetical protein